MVSKALVVGAYQRKTEEMASLPDVSLTLAVPAYWREKGHDWRLERSFTKGYELTTLPMRLNGHYHLHYYQQLGRLIDRVRPDIIHFDEEAYNLSTWLACGAARRREIPMAFFNWQNIARRYPPPFRWFEAEVFKYASLAIAGNRDAAEIIAAKGFTGPIVEIPQFGVDPVLFHPPATNTRDNSCFTIGFVGRLIPAKGLEILLRAARLLVQPWKIVVVGSGPDRQTALSLAQDLGIAQCVTFVGQVGSLEMPSMMRGFDVLAGPSLTTPRWKEQFGRMFVEAMACAVPVIGSDSGEIPRVIGDAGLVVPEGDIEGLAAALARLQADATYRGKLGTAGRERVIARFTQAAVARKTVDAYRDTLRTRGRQMRRIHAVASAVR